MKFPLLFAVLLHLAVALCAQQPKINTLKHVQDPKIVAPYVPLQVVGDTAINLLGRKIIINKDGFPKQIQTFYTEDVTALKDEPNNLLYEGIHFHFTKSDGKDIKLSNGGVHFTKQTPATVEWQSTNKTDSLQVDIHASLNFDGALQYSVKVTALQDLNFKDIVMHIPFQKDMVTYFKGLGQKYGLRPEKVQWKWDSAYNGQGDTWIGNMNAGIAFSLGDEKYLGSLNIKTMGKKSMPIPSSWNNENKGGIDVFVKGSSMLANSYSGIRIMKKGETLYFNFNLLVTPQHLNDKPF